MGLNSTAMGGGRVPADSEPLIPLMKSWNWMSRWDVITGAPRY